MECLTLLEKQGIIKKLLKGKLSIPQASEQAGVSKRTIQRYIEKAASFGLDDLKDKRGGNHRHLTPHGEKQLVTVKQEGPWRSARKTLELTGITTIGIRQVQKIWVKYGLNTLNRERLKPLVRFVAKNPNDLWQTDIMGKIYFPYLNGGGYAYLIANLDDCS